MTYSRVFTGVWTTLCTTLLVLAGCAQEQEPASTEGAAGITAAEAQAIAKEAFVYGYPMVMGYKTMYNYAVYTEDPDYKGPFNHVSCLARVFTPEDTAIVTPNADTPYCLFWMDLRTEPMVLSVPELAPERFYHFQLIDLYTHNFAYVGTLSTGNGAGNYLIAGPDWDGDKPAGIAGVIRSETNFIINVTRTQLFGPDDLMKVEEIQGRYELQPLSAFAGTETPAAASALNFPVWIEGSQFDERVFNYLDFVLMLLDKPLESEQALWGHLSRIGLGPDNSFDFTALPGDIQEALRAGVKDGIGDIENIIVEETDDPLASAKMFGTRRFLQKSAKDNYGHENHYLVRAVAGHIGLYGNSAAEAIYPTYLADSDGLPYDASTNRYTLTFENGKFPPVKAFWSLTMYDGKTQLFINNPLDRYLVNSPMMDQFAISDDGSLVIYISKESPGEALESNWLPAPDGPFYMVLRLYGPEPEALEGKWTPPVLQQAN